jgi:PPM family protein phosphatase
VTSFKVNVCVAQHIGDRQEQQDRVAIITSPRNPGSMLAIVADGMGGRTGGRMAADQVVSTAENLFKDMTERDSTFRDMLLHLAAEAHTVIRLTAIASEKEPHSTLCALIIKKNYAIWAHAGDSRLYFFRSGKLVHRTEDHTYAEQLRLEGRYEDAEIAAGRYKNILVSALGINKKPKIVIGEDASLREGDVFLLASDGMWAYFEDDELAEILQQLSPRDASERLMSLARERAEGRGDNLSVAIIKLEPQPKEALRGRS